MKIKILVACIFVLVTHSTCRKYISEVYSADEPREVEYQLYTDTDFGGDTNVVSFSAVIRTTDNLILWDSALAPMKLKDIPGPENKITFEKNIPHYSSPLKVGFEYSIENVGHSHYVDSFGVSEMYKIVSFNFK
jgi:hypothetical protein